MKRFKGFLLLLTVMLFCMTALADSNTDKVVNFNDLPADYQALFHAEMASALANARSRAPGQSQLKAMARGDFSGYQGSKSDNSLKIEYKVTDSVVAVGEKVTFYATMSWEYGQLTYTYGGQVMDQDFNSRGPLVPSGKPNSFVTTETGPNQIGRAFSFTPTEAGYFNYVIILKDGNGNTLALTTPTVQVYDGEEPSYTGGATDTDIGTTDKNQLVMYLTTDRQSAKVGTEINAVASFSTKHDPVKYYATWTLEDKAGNKLDVKTASGEVNAANGSAEIKLPYQPLQAGDMQLVITATDGYGNTTTINTPWITVEDGFYFKARFNRVSAMMLGNSITATYEVYGHDCPSVAYYVGWECYDGEGNTLSTDAYTVPERNGKVTYTPRQGQGLEFYFGATCEHITNAYPAKLDIALVGALDAELSLKADTVQSGKSISVDYSITGGLTPFQSMVIRGYSYDTGRKKTYQFLTETLTEEEGTVTGVPYLGNEVYFELTVVEKDGVTTVWKSPKAKMTGSPAVADLKLDTALSAMQIAPGESVSLTYKMSGGSGTLNKSADNYLQWVKADGTVLEKKKVTSVSGTASIKLADEGTYYCEMVLVDGYNQQIAWKSEGIVVSAKAYMPGDANGDGQVTPADALRVMQYTAGWSVTINKVNADMDANGTVNLTDALLIFQTAAGN